MNHLTLTENTAVITLSLSKVRTYFSLLSLDKADITDFFLYCLEESYFIFSPMDNFCGKMYMLRNRLFYPSDTMNSFLQLSMQCSHSQAIIIPVNVKR